MMTARRLFQSLSSLCPRAATCAVAATLLVAPAIAQGDLEFRHPGQLLHPILGSITDDGGPFFRVVWGAPTLTTQWSLPPEDKTDDLEGTDASIRFNPVSGRAIAAWLSNGDALFSRFSVGGWSAPTVLASKVSDLELHVSHNGTIHIAFATPDDGGVWHRQVFAGATTWSPAERVSADGEYATRPTLTAHGTRLTIAYEAHLRGPGSTPRNIVVAQVTEDSVPAVRDFVHATVATTYFLEPSRIRLDSEGAGGRLLVRWVAGEELFGWTMQSPRGVWGPVEIEQFEPRGAVGEGRSAKHR